MKFLLPLFFIINVTSAAVDDGALTFGPPTQNGSWHEPPTIIICPSAPVKKDRVERAVDFWENLGYNIGDVIVADTKDISCIRDIVLYGDVLINIANYNYSMKEHLATTRTWKNKENNEIFKAKIEIMSGWGQSERIMEHELGHALGWRDYNQLGHLMHTEWSKGGYKIKGLKNETPI